MSTSRRDFLKALGLGFLAPAAGKVAAAVAPTPAAGPGTSSPPAPAAPPGLPRLPATVDRKPMPLSEMRDHAREALRDWPEVDEEQLHRWVSEGVENLTSPPETSRRWGGSPICPDCHNRGTSRVLEPRLHSSLDLIIDVPVYYCHNCHHTATAEYVAQYPSLYGLRRLPTPKRPMEHSVYCADCGLKQPLSASGSFGGRMTYSYTCRRCGKSYSMEV